MWINVPEGSGGDILKSEEAKRFEGINKQLEQLTEELHKLTVSVLAIWSELGPVIAQQLVPEDAGTQLEE